MRIAICDDEKSCCEAIESAVWHWSDRNAYDISTHVYFSTEKMLLACEEQQYDVVFLNIKYPGEISGYELARRLRASDERLQIVFTTAFSDYAINHLQQAKKTTFQNLQSSRMINNDIKK